MAESSSNRSSTRQIIRSLRAKALKKRHFAARIADWATNYFGTFEFLFLNGIFLSFWILVNSGRVHGIVPFDRFPFILLTMILSIEAIFLTIVVLMSQGRQS